MTKVQLRLGSIGSSKTIHAYRPGNGTIPNPRAICGNRGKAAPTFYPGDTVFLSCHRCRSIAR